MKKNLSILMLIFACVLVLSACSGNKEGNNADPENTENSQNTGDTGNNEDSEDAGDAEDPEDSVDSGEEDSGDGVDPGNSEETDGTENSGGSDDPARSELDNMIAQIMEEIEQRPTMELEADMVNDFYHLDPEILEDYAIHLPMFNISTNEVAILKVKDAKDLPTVEAAVKKRAEDVQKQFETYLPDQYENAKNYKLVTKDQYVLFVIDNAATAEAIVQLFESYFENK